MLATFIVNSIDDTEDANPGDGIAADSDGNTTLRAAIMEAHVWDGPDTIEFAIPGDGPHTIQPLSALPTIWGSLVIDGYTQTGASPNSNPMDQAINAVLKIELDGSQAVNPDGSKPDGLKFQGANDSIVRGLVINRFAGNGIYLYISDSGVVEGNFIGTDVTGTLGLGNKGLGIHVLAGSNTIGGTGPGARNLISANYIGAHVGQTSVVQGNFVGTDLTGTKALGNVTYGIRVSDGVTVGGTAVGAGNLISGNGGIGVMAASHQLGPLIKVQGNLIGTDLTGTAALGNAEGVRASYICNVLIGGTDPGARNVISGNTGAGVGLHASDVTVQGNFIGTDIAGTSALGNGSSGIYAYPGVSNNLIGGTADGAGNVISGNLHGIEFNGATNNTVQGNFIGTDETGKLAIGNDTGIYVVWGASLNLIGGTTPGAGNVISGNTYGIAIFRGATGNVVQGNLIGTDVTGTGVLGNGASGVWIDHADTSNNTIGGTAAGEGNTIAFNSDRGVEVGYSGQLATGNSIRGNSIHSNGGLGIDLGAYGVTLNDGGDADAGPNNLQNFPVISESESLLDETRVAGALNSLANTTFTLDFYANTTADPSGYGEGERYLGWTTVTTDAFGNVGFDVILAAATAPGEFITATATDPDGSTSEFSAVLVVEQGVQAVQIDIKPGSDPNAINLGSNGTVPVAILGSADFDATTVDPTTVTLADAGVKLRGKGTPMASQEDVNGDGFMDFVVHVETQAFALTAGDTVAVLEARTYAGMAIQGVDTVHIVQALHAAGAVVIGSNAGGPLTQAMLHPAIEEGVSTWGAVGVAGQRLDGLRGADVRIADLSGAMLGMASKDILWIDRDAAGYGWSIEAGSGVGGVDLRSVVTHELGHLLGLGHDDAYDVMAPTLAPGIRAFGQDPLATAFADAVTAEPLSSTSFVADELFLAGRFEVRWAPFATRNLLLTDGSHIGSTKQDTEAVRIRDQFFESLAEEPTYAALLEGRPGYVTAEEDRLNVTGEFSQPLGQIEVQGDSPDQIEENPVEEDLLEANSGLL